MFVRRAGLWSRVDRTLCPIRYTVGLLSPWPGLAMRASLKGNGSGKPERYWTLSSRHKIRSSLVFWIGTDILAKSACALELFWEFSRFPRLSVVCRLGKTVLTIDWVKFGCLLGSCYRGETTTCEMIAKLDFGTMSVLVGDRLSNFILVKSHYSTYGVFARTCHSHQ